VNRLIPILLVAAIVAALFVQPTMGKDKDKEKKKPALQIFAMVNGEVVPFEIETGFANNEPTLETVGAPVGSPYTQAETVRISGGQAKIRFKKGDGFNFLAEFPPKFDPRNLELIRYKTQGKQRIAQLKPFGMSTGGHSVWNVVNFRVGTRKDGKSVLIPPTDLEAGEYCFSQLESMDHYCFGVDPA
jgi:hypothetical protein